ncbi:hypothetical protein [Sedimenticola selenatireducens]|uniref:hypothetical protein n=1 Tax=Sedimenticola selenatireducens TaxID=191960 RepID=UPI002AABF1FF|nr:hypothetical protein [Sedimenticola selenatireducens]
MPLAGHPGTGGDTDFFFLFEIPKLEQTRLFSSPISDGLGITLEVFEVPMDFIHKQLFGQWVAWLLTAGHVLAALYHHYILRAPHLTGS